MCYLWIKENDAKTFKSFLSGNEIEVGLFVNPSYHAFDAGNQIEIFYGEENNDSYAAEIRKQEYLHPSKRSDRSYVRLSLKKV